MKRHDTPPTGPQTPFPDAGAVIIPLPRDSAALRPLSAAPGRGTVYVIAPLRQQRRQAVCTCGWTGPRRRILRSLTATDAHIHTVESGCTPARPLVHFALPTVTGEAS